MDHFKFFATGYMVFVVVLFVYIFLLHEKVKRLQSKIDRLKK